jgi:hypothetical protein
MKISSPKSLFRKYANRQAWGGSPGVECSYDYDFRERHAYSVLKLEQIGSEGEDEGGDSIVITESEKDDSIRLQFSERRSFDAFVSCAVFGGKKIITSRLFGSGDKIYLDSCGFS